MNISRLHTSLNFIFMGVGGAIHGFVFVIVLNMGVFVIALYSINQCFV
jgi:hypothetical protein